MEYKTCSKCKQPFPATSEFFSPDKQSKNNLRSWCKKCCNEQNREWFKNNPEYQHAWYKNNSELHKQQSRKRYKKNKEKILQQGREYYQDNKEKVSRRGREYRKNNPDKMAAKAAKRKAMKLKQTPILTEDETKKIGLYYRISQQMGLDWQVDHIQPLIKGGLHHPNNLQIVTASYNLQKGSKLNFRKPTETEYFKL